ncbi:MAG TPA: SCP2 sterol-binding domain-containing protein [Polyangiaceae bacterium]|nr:SCP2 sterol-binding domain-containing protein [Polyangiaceae bacterium]
MIVPESAAELIGKFLPSFVGELLARGAPAPAQRPLGPGAKAPAPAGVGLRVVGAGEWTLRIVGDASANTAPKLVVEAGIASDVALQISLAERDFAALVVAPLQRALAAGTGTGTSAPGLWARLGRWDEETVELLRRQTGGILLRIRDGELNRCVALTPSTQPFSLESAPCTIDCALSDLEQLQAQRGNPLDLFYAGQIRISGDAQIALAMAGLFL